MKKIQKEISHIEYKDIWEASDGTQFITAEECSKYESLAAGVVYAKLLSISICKPKVGIDDCEEDEYITVIPTKEEHIDWLNQLYGMFGGVNRDPLFSKEDFGNPILIGKRMCSSGIIDCWFYKLNEFVKEVTDGTFKLVCTNSQ